MSTDRSVDPQAVEETKQQIRGLVGEIAALTRQELDPAIFYGEFLQRVITALAAVGGAVWVLRDNELRLTYQINLRQAFPEDNGDDQARHGRLLHRVIKNGEHLLVPPYSGTAGDEEAGNPTSFLLVLSPIRDQEDVVGIVEIFQRPTSGPASQRGYLRFLSEMCQHVGDYLRGRKLQELTDWQSLFTEVDRFSRAVHEGLDPTTTAYTIANEGRRLIGCDRVSVALRKGRRCKIVAVSGQDTMDTRSNAVTLLGKLATAVMRSGEPLWYTGHTDDLPPQIEDAVADYVDETHTKTVAVVPLSRPSEEVPDGDDNKKKLKRDEDNVIGTLIVEQIEDSRAPAEFAQSVDMVCEHSCRALGNSLEHEQLFLMPVWRTIGKAKWMLQARTLPKTLAVAAAVLAFLLFMCFYPKKFEMKAEGTLDPSIRRNVFVSVDGNVKSVNVEHGDTVKQGDVLIVLENRELKSQLVTSLGELATSEQERASIRRAAVNRALDKAERNQLAAQQLQLLTRIKSLKEEIQILEAQIADLVVSSPIDGIVVTWDLRELLPPGRPLQRGEAPLTVADPTGEWELEVFMKEARMGHVVRALPEDGGPLPVTYLLQTDSRDKFQGELQQHNIHDQAQLHDEHSHSVRLIIDLDEADLKQPRPGTEVKAKVLCGTEPIGYVFFHELIEFIQSRPPLF